MPLARKTKQTVSYNSRSGSFGDGGVIIIQPYTWLHTVDPNLIAALLEVSDCPFEIDDIPESATLNIRDAIEAFKTISPSGLGRRDVLGKYHFEHLSETLEMLQTLFEHHENMELEVWPLLRQQNFVETLSNLVSTTNQIHDLSNIEAGEQHHRISQDFFKFHDELFSLWSEHTPTKLSEETVNLGIRLRELEGRLETSLSDQKSRFDNLYNELQKNVEAATISSEAQRFNSEAKKNFNQSVVWAFLSAIMIISILLYLFVFSNDDTKSTSETKIPACVSKVNLEIDKCAAIEPSREQLIDKYIDRFSILGVLILLTGGFMSLYRSERHNQVVNLHRANALDTFNAMTEAQVSDSAKEAVSLAAASAIFTPQPSGFSKQTPETETPKQVIQSLAKQADS